LPCGARAALRSCHQVRISGARRQQAREKKSFTSQHQQISTATRTKHLRTPCSSRCCARLVLASALSACRPLSPLSRPSLRECPSLPFACQTPYPLPCSSLWCRKILPPVMTFILFCGANVPRPPKERYAASALFRNGRLPFPFLFGGPQGTQLWNATVSRPHPSRGCRKQRASRRRGATQKGGKERAPMLFSSTAFH
jgi:hypothetical protein